MDGLYSYLRVSDDEQQVRVPRVERALLQARRLQVKGPQVAHLLNGWKWLVLAELAEG